MGNRSLQPVQVEPNSADVRDDVGTMLKLTARTLGGDAFTCTVHSKDSVATLKQALEQQSCVPSDHQEVLLGATVLKDAWVLSECAVSDEAELTLINRGPFPECAKEMGLTRDHPDLLREYHATHNLKEPDFLTCDEAIWEELRRLQETYNEARLNLNGWNSFVRLTHADKINTPAAAFYLAPGQSVEVIFDGFIYNGGRDACIHQLLLALDTNIVAELYHGVPMSGRDFTKHVKVVAPPDPGIYMLWKSHHLMYTMAHARGQFKAQFAEIVVEGHYPSRFVGWIIVN